MPSRNFIAILGIIIAFACYLEQNIAIMETGHRKKVWTVLIWAIGALTTIAMIVSGH